MDYAIVDLEGFKNCETNKFIVKELSFLTQNIKFSDIIKSEIDFDTWSDSSKRAAQWLTETYHGINWGEGYIGVEELKRTISPILMNKIIYVKGEEKVNWLRNLLATTEKEKQDLLIVNIELIGCDICFYVNDDDKNDIQSVNQLIENKNRMSSYDHRCPQHKEKSLIKKNLFVCTLRNVIRMKRWYSYYCKQKK